MAAFTEIDNPELYFQAKAYTGNGSSSHAITFDNTDTSMQPDLVWIKNRNNAEDNVIFDSVRGGTKRLYSNGNHVEGTNDAINSFDSNGFNLNTASSLNYNTYTYVAWCWKGGTTSGITTNGSTTITPAGYSFSATSGVSIVKYAGNGSSGAKYPHGLGVTPKMVMVKNLGTTDWWNVHHTSLGNNSEMYLNTTDAAPATSGNGTTPDSVNIDLEGTGTAHNGSSNNYIAYVFADVQGFSKFGSYEGNGNANGPFVYLGFRPAYVMYKPADSADNWEIHDNKRDTINPMETLLYANLNNAEGGPSGVTDRLDFLSNGFKILDSGGHINTSGNKYIFMAFSEAPFCNSSGVPCNAR